MRKNLAIAFIMTAICTISNAQAAPPSPPLKGGTCWAYTGNDAAISATAQFTCDGIGKVTIAQIYEKGYRVVAIFQHPKRLDILSVIIEEQR